MPSESIGGDLERFQGKDQGVENIISNKPHFILRWSNVFFLFLFLLALMFSTIIEYSDIVNCTARIQANYVPKTILSKTEGRIKKLYVKNEENVEAGQLIAMIENSALENEIDSIKNWLKEKQYSLSFSNVQYLLSRPPPHLNKLGDLQEEYNKFCEVFFETSSLVKDGYYLQQEKALSRNLALLDTLRINSEIQIRLKEEDFELKAKEFKVYEKLASDKVIAPLELHEYRSRVLENEQAIKQAQAAKANNELSAINKQKEILDNRQKYLQQILRLITAFKSFLYAFDDYVNRHYLVSPEAGQLHYVKSLQVNQYIKNEDDLFYVQPKISGYLVEGLVAQSGIGRLQVGNRAVLIPKGFPESEYGYLIATIDYVSNRPIENDSFFVKMKLTKGLKTNFDRQIYFRNSLLADAKIITKRRTIFSRIIGDLRKLVIKPFN